jgi:hypothetical protein
VNLYITFADKSKIKKSFLNLRKYLVIHTPEVVESFGFKDKTLDDCSMFLVNEEIKRQIQRGSSRRKLYSIVYSNPLMSDETIREIIYYSSELPNVEKVVFLTEEGKNEEYFELFDEVSFFPSIKKVHILQCKTLLVGIESESSLNELNGNASLG